MLGTVRIQGADAKMTNTSAGVWAAATQVTTAPSFLCKLVVFVPTAIGANRVIWIIDTATGSASSVDPVALVCPNGFTTTLDFGDYGRLFVNGIYIVVATNEPSGPTTNYVAGAANDARIHVDYKVK